MTTTQAAVAMPAAGKKAARPAAASVAAPIGMASELTLAWPSGRLGVCACGGECPRCRTGTAVQAKLELSRPGDACELEADRVADHVIQMQAAPCSCGGDCPSCRGRTAARIQRTAQPANSGTLAVPDGHLQAFGSGQRLDTALRGYFEPRFGQDFSHVRIHTDVRAAAAAENLGAMAYTSGEHIVFGAGRYAPQTIAGRRLIAHELTHVVQQGGMGRGPEVIQRACGAAAIGTPAGCSDHDRVFLPGYPAFSFNPDCDDFAPGQQAALVAAATALPASAALEIHGFADTSGRAPFNQNVSCARALRAQTVLTDPAPAGAGITAARIAGVFSHGPTPGPSSGRRVVVITPPRATPLPATVPTLGATDFEITRVSKSRRKMLFFERGSSALTLTALARIRAHRVSPPGTVRLVGFASSDEAATVAQDRATAVRAALTAPATPAVGASPAQSPVTVSSAVGNAAATASRSDFVAARSVEIIIGAAPPSIVDCAARDPVTRALLNPPTQACTLMDPPTWTAFNAALPIAQDAMTRAVASVAGTPTADDALVIDRFFGNHSAGTLTILQTNLANLETHVNNLPATTSCGGQCDTGGCAEGPIAYNNDVDAASTMTLCVPVFAKLHVNDAARNLIHESAHGTSPLGGAPRTGTRDVAYRHERMLFQLTPAERRRNSDSYALFALFLREIQTTGVATAVPAGISTPATDALPGFGTDEPALRLALARLEKRLTWAADWTGQLYGQIDKIRNRRTTWAASFAEDWMREAAARFPLTAPRARPTLTDQTRVAGILDRYSRMRAAVKRDLTATPMAAGVVSWPAPSAASFIAGDTLEVGPDFFRATPEDQVSLLLEAVAQSTRHVEPAFVPAYVSLARWFHEQNP